MYLSKDIKLVADSNTNNENDVKTKYINIKLNQTQQNINILSLNLSTDDVYQPLREKIKHYREKLGIR